MHIYHTQQPLYFWLLAITCLSNLSASQCNESETEPAIDMETQDVVFIKNIANRTYDDLTYDNQKDRKVKEIKESITYNEKQEVAIVKYHFRSQKPKPFFAGSVYVQDTKKQKDFAVIAFRGTVFKCDWEKNFAYTHKSATQLHSKLKGKMHQGFSERALDIWPSLLQALEKAVGKTYKGKIYFTGHSLGGALALLLATKMAYTTQRPPHHLRVITFSAPRVGNPTLTQAIYQKIPQIDILNFINTYDPVPKVPPEILLYSNTGVKIEMLASRSHSLQSNKVVAKAFASFKHIYRTTDYNLEQSGQLALTSNE